MTEKTIRKLIDLPESTVKKIAKEAIDNGTNFKNHLEEFIEKHFGNKKTRPVNQQVKAKKK